MKLSFRDPRTYQHSHSGEHSHPGFSRDAELFTRCMSWLKAEVVAEARSLGITQTDLLNNILAERYRGKLIEPTPEQLAEAKTLTPEEAVSHLDPTLRGDQSRDDLVAHFESVAAKEPLTLEVLEQEEDKVIERLYQDQLDAAEKKASTGKTSDPFGPQTKGQINQARYAEEIRLAKEKKAREDKARAKRREYRRTLLCVAAQMVAPSLRKEGPSQNHRQQEDRSHWATHGGYTRRDIAEANKDSS